MEFNGHPVKEAVAPFSTAAHFAGEGTSAIPFPWSLRRWQTLRILLQSLEGGVCIAACAVQHRS